MNEANEIWGVVSDWGEISIVWYDSPKKAFDNAVTGDIVIKKIEEIK